MMTGSTNRRKCSLHRRPRCRRRGFLPDALDALLGDVEDDGEDGESLAEDLGGRGGDPVKGGVSDG